jgi:Bcr/CflA subfamily drug resistance transporter
MTTVTSPKPYSHTFIIFLLVIMGVMSQFSSDNFLPSLPYIAIDLNAAKSITKLAIGLYLLGLCFSTLIYGPLSDRYGRRRIVLIGYVIFIFGCILVTTTHSITQLLIGRVVQALGIGAGAALFRAIMRDVFAGNQLAKIGSLLGTIFAIVPPLAPLSGGYVQVHFGWRANFAILLILAIIFTTILAIALPETFPSDKRQRHSLKQIIRTYAELLTHRAFLGYTACSGLAFANIIVYVTISPFLFQHTLHLTPIQFGWLSPITAMSYMVGTLLNIRLLNFYSSQSLLRIAGFIMLAGAIIMLALGLIGILNVWVIMLPLMLICIANGFVFSNAFACAFEPFPQAAGITGALFSSLQMLTAGVASSLAALIPAHNQVIMASALTLISLLIVLNVKFVLRLG